MANKVSEEEFIRAALRGLCANPNIMITKDTDPKKLAKLAHMIGHEQYKRLNINKNTEE